MFQASLEIYVLHVTEEGVDVHDAEYGMRNNTKISTVSHHHVWTIIALVKARG